MLRRVFPDHLITSAVSVPLLPRIFTLQVFVSPAAWRGSRVSPEPLADMGSRPDDDEEREHRRRRIAAEDFHLQLCQCYAASDSPFGHLDCQTLVNALQTAFSDAHGQGKDMRAVPSGVVSAALRGFLGVGGSLWHYEQRMCAMLRATYGEPLDATELISDFGARLGAAQSGAGSAGAGFLSKVDLRRALVEWPAPLTLTLTLILTLTLTLTPTLARSSGSPRARGPPRAARATSRPPRAAPRRCSHPLAEAPHACLTLT